MISPISTRYPLQKRLRLIVPLMILTVCGGLLWQRVAVMDIPAIGDAIAQVSIGQWILAIVATWCSFQAIGRYDAVWHRVLRTGVSPDPARRAGIKAIALAQTLGFGALTGSLVRWRCLPALSLWQVTQLSLAVTVTFTLCWAAYAVCALWWLGPEPEFLQISTPITLCLLIILTLGVVAGRRRFAPHLASGDIAALIGLTAVDMLFAALALYVLMPETLGLAFNSILAAYVVALGVGLISNTPGGAGAFDLTLLALLPLSAPEPLVAAIIAFRIVYYLCPALLALIAIGRPITTPQKMHNSPASWGLARQSGEISHGWHIGRLPGVAAALGPQPKNAINFNILRSISLLTGRTVALYNCNRRSAKAARDLGWYVRRTAMEAMIRPKSWSTAGGKRQTLRRKLRHAAQAGVTISQARVDLPMAQMQQIAREWAVSHGGEHGFSMGRFCPIYVADQRIFLIKHNGQLIGFVTFNDGKTDWVLDLIRHKTKIPDGAVQAAIVAAIDAAKSEEITHLSLSCAPDPRFTPAFWASRRAGLIQFKRSFGPIWVPRYHAAPNQAAFWFTGLIIGIAIHRPLPNLVWKWQRIRRDLNISVLQGRFAIELNRKT